MLVSLASYEVFNAVQVCFIYTLNSRPSSKLFHLTSKWVEFNLQFKPRLALVVFEKLSVSFGYILTLG